MNKYIDLQSPRNISCSLLIIKCKTFEGFVREIDFPLFNFAIQYLPFNFLIIEILTIIERVDGVNHQL